MSYLKTDLLYTSCEPHRWCND